MFLRSARGDTNVMYDCYPSWAVQEGLIPWPGVYQIDLDSGLTQLTHGENSVRDNFFIPAFTFSRRGSLFSSSLVCSASKNSIGCRAELWCTFLSCAVSKLATLHPTELLCTTLSYAATYWAMVHLTELCCIQISHAAPCWATLHPTELRWTPRSYAEPYKATLLHTVLGYTLLNLRCSLLSYTVRCWATFLS